MLKSQVMASKIRHRSFKVFMTLTRYWLAIKSHPMIKQLSQWKTLLKAHSTRLNLIKALSVNSNTTAKTSWIHLTSHLKIKGLRVLYQLPASSKEPDSNQMCNPTKSLKESQLIKNQLLIPMTEVKLFLIIAPLPIWSI